MAQLRTAEVVQGRGQARARAQAQLRNLRIPTRPRPRLYFADADRLQLEAHERAGRCPRLRSHSCDYLMAEVARAAGDLLHYCYYYSVLIRSAYVRFQGR